MVLIHSTPFEAKWDGSEVDIVWSGQTNKMTVQKEGNDIVYTIYSGNNVIYQFDGVGEINDTYIGFLIDDTNEVAKPSMIYVGSDNYSYNQEEPTEEQMADIYTWLSAGLPSE